jgi:L-fuconolactonase
VIVDAHHHVWDPAAARHDWLAGFPALDRRFDLSDFAEASAGCEVGASVLVQVLASAAETESFLSVAAGSGGLVAGVVGWADLTSPAISDELARLRSLPGGSFLVGIRHLVQDEPDPDWLRRPDVYRGLRAVGAAGLRYDLLVRPTQLPAAIEVAAELADVPFVLDHGAKPSIAAGVVEPWAALVGELGRLPNVACKFSGLVTEAGPDWTAGQIAPYATHLLEVFGPARLMFGSDWPVCTLAASYSDVVGLARELTRSLLSPAEAEDLFEGNALRWYQLG